MKYVKKQIEIHYDSNNKPHKIYSNWLSCFKSLIDNKNMRVVKNTFKYCASQSLSYYMKNYPSADQLLTTEKLKKILKKHPDLLEYFI